MLVGMKLWRRIKGKEGKEGAKIHRTLREVKMRRMEVEKLEKKGCWGMNENWKKAVIREEGACSDHVCIFLASINWWWTITISDSHYSGNVNTSNPAALTEVQTKSMRQVHHVTQLAQPNEAMLEIDNTQTNRRYIFILFHFWTFAVV